MPIMDRLTAGQIDDAVRKVLDSLGETSFEELEKQVVSEVPSLAGSLQVRQAIWRLVNTNGALMTKGLRLKSIQAP